MVGALWAHAPRTWLGLGRGIAVIAVTNAADLTTGLTSLALDGWVGRMLGYHETGR